MLQRPEFEGVIESVLGPDILLWDCAYMELAPGQASLHQGWTVHSSGPNMSDSRRVGTVMNFLKPSVQQIVGEYESATLLRGEDHL